MKILIVDDNRNMRETLKMMLGANTHEFFECEEGSASVELYNKEHPDWVLMDIRMKGMDGITATKQLVKQHATAKVLIVTDYDDEKLRNAARDAGAVAYIAKEHLTDISLFITNSNF